MKIKTKFKLSISVIAVIFTVVALFSFVFGQLISLNLIDYDKELPLSNEVGGIIVTDQNIYIGIINFNRVQKYTLDGSFVKSYKVNNYRKSFTFHVENNIPIMDFQDINKPYNEFEFPFQYLYNGIRYKIEDRFYNVSFYLIKEKNNNKTIVIKNPVWTMFIFGEPNIIFPMLLIGVILLAVIYRDNLDNLITKRGSYNGESQENFLRSKM